mmetsp:Transcript_6113/g.6343  ORF Transcript_6113/g.6343 Transcript_6113/m.6343 type:complete len:860 (+) Transcript_6113:18-2597(+)
METIKEISFQEHQYLINPSKQVPESQKSKLTLQEQERLVEQTKAEENLYERMCLDLPLYQDKIKRDKDLYKEEFAKFLSVFIPKFNSFLETPASNHKNIKEVFVFLAHLSHIFPKELAFLPAQLKDLLEHSHAIIHPEIRMAIIDSFNLLRKKNLIEPVDILPLMFQLLTCQDKELRQRLQEIIINDLERINEKAKNHKVNKFIRNKCSEMLLNPNYKAARKTLNIIILLYKKKVWNDEKTVNAIAQACYSKDSKIAYASCKFFLSEYEEMDEESEDDEMGELKQKYKLLGKGNNKKTKKRKDKIKTLMKAVERRETRKAKIKLNKDFMPIDLINDPTSLCERMFERIKHVKNRKHYKLKVVLIRLIGRFCGRHKIVVSNFFSFCATLIRPKQDELSTILASVIEATHHMVSATDLEPVINELYYYFICESFPALYITIGVNTLREIIERCPNAIKYDQYTAVEDLRKVKNKSVSTAVRSFINMVRDVNEDLMDNKVVEDKEYTHMNVPNSIEGMDLLKMHEGMSQNYQLESNELLTDKQLKKLRLLRMKENAESVQRIRLNLSKGDVNEMLGEKREKGDDDKKGGKNSKSNIAEMNSKRLDTITNKNNKKGKKNEMSLREEAPDLVRDSDVEGDDQEDDAESQGSDLSDCSILDDMEEMEEDESYVEEEDEDEEGEGEEIDDIDLDELEELEGEEIEDSEMSEEDPDKAELNDLLDSKEDDKDPLKENSEDMSEEDEARKEFVSEDQLNTYKMTFREKRDLNKIDDEKEDFKLKRKKKKDGQKTNYEARKNKPMQMVIHKVKRKKMKTQNDKNLGMRIKNIKRQLGRFKRGNMILNKKGGDVKKTKKKLSKKNKKKKI